MIEGAEPGGVEMTATQLAAGELRADLCQLAQTFAFPRGSRFIDLLLTDYTVTRKRSVKKKPAAPYKK